MRFPGGRSCTFWRCIRAYPDQTLRWDVLGTACEAHRCTAQFCTRRDARALNSTDWSALTPAPRIHAESSHAHDPNWPPNGCGLHWARGCGVRSTLNLTRTRVRTVPPPHQRPAARIHSTRPPPTSSDCSSTTGAALAAGTTYALLIGSTAEWRRPASVAEREGA
eukprot:10153-Prymnesium_polylepis.2